MDDEGQNAGMESVEGVHRGTGFACADVKKRLAAIHIWQTLFNSASRPNKYPGFPTKPHAACRASAT
jgi:hypothetical protein